MICIDEVKKIEIHLLETSSKSARFLLVYCGKSYEASNAIVSLLQVLKETDSIEQVSCLYSKLMKKEFDVKKIRELIDTYIKPIIESKEQITPQSLFFKRKIITGEKISQLSTMLKFLFNIKFVFVLLSVVFCLEILFFQDISLITNFHVDIYTAIFIFNVFIFSSFVHELGHASACKFYNIDHGEIGFGFYLNFPVFYTDVSNVWKLLRKQRLVINFAGVYFQLLLLIPLLLLYFYTYSALLKYAIYVININFLITLNPFFKFDGYWIVSDLLGVPNLRKRTNELIIYYLNRIKNKNITNKPFLFQMNKKEKICLFIYSCIVNMFFVYYFLYLLPSFLYEFVNTFPSDIKELMIYFSSGEVPDFQLFQNTVLKIIFFVFIIYLLVRIFWKEIHRLKKIVRI